ncbi:MAG: hypothetical protein KC996_04400 [Phycisphaerales bacterium]|nr:hypothetical protein [Phycisphaerales bacterium]
MPKHSANTSLGPIALCAFLLLLVVLLVSPALGAIVGSLRTLDSSEIMRWTTPARAGLLARSSAIAAAIAMGATMLGVPIGWVIGSGRSRLSPLLIAPMWLPSLLLYAAFNLLRAPETRVGAMLIELASNGHRWVPIWSGYLLASLGLVVWASPIAGVLLAPIWSCDSGGFDSQLRVEPLGRMRKARLWIGAHRGVLFRAWGILTVVFLGSAVPMHLAQFDTWSIVLWRELSQRGPDEWGTVWVGAVPVMLIACVGASLVLGVVGSIERSASRTRGVGVGLVRLPVWVRVWAWGVWSLAVLVPILAMLWSLDDLRSIVQFWRLQGGAFADSAGVSAIAGVCSVFIAVCVAAGIGHPSAILRRAGKASVFALVAIGLAPGVLVGAAVAKSFVDGYTAVVLAACARTAFIGAIVGALIGASEPGAQRALRWVEGSVGLGAWSRTVLARSWAPLAGAAVAGGLVALSEIEASVLVRPPGMRNLPQQLLSDLHYARLEQLSAAGVNLLGIGIFGGLFAIVLLRGIRVHSQKSGNRPGLGE